MAVNPAGAVQIFDFGHPKVITCYAAADLTAGQLCKAASTDTVSSGANSFVATDLTVDVAASGAAFLGVVLATTSSGGAAPIALEGVFIVRAENTVTVSQQVATLGAHGVLDGVTAGQVIGRAITGATSGGYALIHIKG